MSSITVGGTIMGQRVRSDYFLNERVNY
jgi:hypothetical protein